MKNLELAAEAYRAVTAGGGRPCDAAAAAAFVTGCDVVETFNALIAAGVVEFEFYARPENKEYPEGLRVVCHR